MWLWIDVALGDEGIEYSWFCGSSGSSVGGSRTSYFEDDDVDCPLPS